MQPDIQHLADALRRYAQSSLLLQRLSSQPLDVPEFSSPDGRRPVHRYRIILQSAAHLLVYTTDTEAADLLGFLPDTILDDLYRNEPTLYHHFVVTPVLDLAHAYDPDHADFDLELTDADDLADYRRDAKSFYTLAEHLAARRFADALTHYSGLDTTLRETVAELDLVPRLLRYYH